MNNDLQIKDIQDGQTVDGVFLVKEMSRAETRAGKPYLSLVLMDRSGEISGRVWDNADQLMDRCPTGAVITLKAQAQSYKGILQLKVNEIHTAEGLDPADFMPEAPGDVKSMASEFMKLVKSVEDPHLNHLLLAIFKKRTFFERFKKAPAAKAMHHAYSGGLLEHTLGVARLADLVSDLYPTVDRSLLLSGAFLHDIGKMREFSFDAFPFDYSTEGRLVGHMVLGIGMIDDKIAEIPGFPDETAARLKHLILSHHGRYEFGSPTLPMMLEAFVLNFIDDLDAKVNYINRLSGQVQESGYHWSEYQRNLERFLYLRGSNGDEENSRNNENGEDFDPRQRNLWG